MRTSWSITGVLLLLWSCAEPAIGPSDCWADPELCPEPPPRCRSDADCADPARPLCDARLRDCRGCERHSECRVSQVCRYDAALPDVVPVGACLPRELVAQVDGRRCTPGQTDGTLERPYCDVQDAVAARWAYVTVRPKELSTPYRPLTISGGRVAILGPGRDLEVQAVLGGLTVSGSETAVLLADLAVQTSTDGPAVLCREGQLTLFRTVIANSREGISSTDGCRLTIERSRIANIGRTALRAGTSARHRIANSLFVYNGREFTAVDRANLADVVVDLGSNLMDNVFTFNTLAGNQGVVSCRTGQVLKNSIITRRGASPFRNQNCAFPQSFVGDEDAARLDGSFALTRDSQCCVDLAAPDPAIATDYDGIARPQGAGYDIGCHELKE
jgi:hypothetical protein